MRIKPWIRYNVETVMGLSAKSCELPLSTRVLFIVIILNLCWQEVVPTGGNLRAAG